MDEVKRQDSIQKSVVWLEILGRHREVVSRTRLAADAVTLGRAYDNDIVLDDPHVAAHHLRIARGDDGTWVAEDLGSVNGLVVDGERVRRERIVLGDATSVLAGHTGIRLRHAGDAVPAELPMVRSTPRWPLAIICIVLLFGLEWLGLWLGETGEPKLIRYLTPLATIAIAIAVWATLWSVVSRVFSGHARFGLHLLIVTAGLLAFSLYDQFSDLGAFALSWTRLSSTVYVAAWIAFAAVCVAQLRAISNTKLPLKAAAVVALAALGIAMQSLKLSDWRASSGQAATLQKLEPPSIRIASAQAESAFFATNDALKAGLDKARSEEPSGDGDTGGSDD
jgi:hypothetical protein